MKKIRVDDEDQIIVGVNQTAEEMLESHGYDPDETDYTLFE